MLSGRIESLPSPDYSFSFQPGSAAVAAAAAAAQSVAPWYRSEKKSSSPLPEWRRSSPQSRKVSRSPQMPSQAAAAQPRRNEYWLPGEGIRREVIQADICRYLGNDALVKPGTYEGRDGYWITAYRALTTNMIVDLKNDSQRWAEEAAQFDTRVPYSDSRTHTLRQRDGPSQPGTASAAEARNVQQPTQLSYDHYGHQAAQYSQYGTPAQVSAYGQYAPTTDYPPVTQPYTYNQGSHLYPATEPRTMPSYTQPAPEGNVQYNHPGSESYHPNTGVSRGSHNQPQPHARDPYGRPPY